MRFGECLVILFAIIPFRVYICFMKNIGETVKDLRKKAGLDQVEFAKRAGVGLRFVRELEQGKTTVRLDKVSQVLDFLGHHIEVIRNGKG